VGDLAFVYADRLLASANPAARGVWDDLRTEINIGQYLDLLGTARGGADLDTARRIATYKSAKYTVERPLHLGAALAGRLPELAEGLSAYGLPLGEAFQLRDDLLGVFGDPAVTGKPVGADLIEGKPTSLLAMARDGADKTQRAALARVGDHSLDGDAVAALQDALRATGAVDLVEDRITTLHDEAVAAIARTSLTPAASAALTELAGTVAWREK
jgi:geranylgeranyl diphosphate synthase type I